MDLLIGTSLITAFVAGIAALFAPCCVTVLLPSYLASVFKQKKLVFLMTLIFFLGILAVFLPLGLGIAAIGTFFKEYHNALYTVGGSFLIFLGISILLGKHFSLGLNAHKLTQGKVDNAGGVFLLGVFSGFATLCCAPVLAGVMALSALPGSLFWGGIYSLVYALGMVTPLFLIAYFLDRSNVTERFTAFNKPVGYSVIGKKINLTISELIAGLMYLSMGALTIYLDWTGKLAMGGGAFQTSINISMARFNQFLRGYITYIPKEAWLALLLILCVIIVKIAVRGGKNRSEHNTKKGSHACCEIKETKLL